MHRSCGGTASGPMLRRTAQGASQRIPGQCSVPVPDRYRLQPAGPDAAVAASRMAHETGRHFPAPPVRDGRAGVPPCPAAGPEGRPVQPGPARGNPLADAHLPAALISRSFRTVRDLPKAATDSLARNSPSGQDTRPATAFRHGNLRRHAPNPAFWTGPEHPKPRHSTESRPAADKKISIYGLG